MHLFKRVSKIKTSSIFEYITQINIDDICIDCGANVGKITNQMAKAGAEVYAFEPNPFAFYELEKNTSQYDNITCIQKGVYIEDIRKELYFHENSDQDEVFWSTGSSLIEFKGNINKNKKMLVDLVDLDRFIVELDHPIKLLKMDVEGVEIEIINKLIDTGTIFKIEYLLVETHENKIPELRKSTKDLRNRIRKLRIKNINMNWI